MRHFLLWMMVLATSTGLLAQGTETFSNIPASASGYATRNWTGDGGINWTATDARTDQTITGRAIAIRQGAISAAAIPNGIGTLQFSFKYLFTAGGNARIVVRINGDSITQVIIPTTATTNQVSPVIAINRGGPFSIELRQANPSPDGIASVPRVAIDDVTWTAFSSGPCVAPAAQPTGINFSAITSGSISGSFSPSSPAADEYLVVRSLSNSLGAAPADGQTYSAEDALGSGTVISRGPQTSFTDAGLTAGTTYYYFVFSLNSNCNGGPLYIAANPLTGNAATSTPVACATPAAAISNLQLGAANTSISGSFAAAAGADGYLVLRTTVPALNFTPANGVSYAIGSTQGNGVVVKFGEGTTFSSSALTSNTTYYFHVFSVNGFSCTGGPLYSTGPVSGNATTTSGTNEFPDGYYNNADGKSCADLKTALKTITTTGMTPRGYSALLSQYAITDIKPREVGTGSANVIWDIYSDRPGPANDPYNYDPAGDACGSGEGQGWNREHSVPQSWFTGGTSSTQGSDYHHIFPTDCQVNSWRGSWIYSEVSNPTTTSQNGSKVGSSSFAGLTGTAFEPIDEYKGDVARAFFYFVTRYQDNMTSWSGGSNGGQAFEANTFPSIDIPYLRLMLKWHEQDPVSEKERVRNNGAFSFQRNRNPFVDKPEYVALIWNSNCPGLGVLPVNLLYFKGAQRGNIAHLQWQLPAGDNALRFDVERSTNGQKFETIGTVAANPNHLYNFEDAIDKIGGRRVYYRLKAYYPNKPADYSDIVSMHLSANTTFSVFPNPAQRKVNLDFGRNLFTGEVIVTNFTGQRVAAQKVSRVTGSIAIDLPMLATGRYTITLMDASGRVSPVVQSFQVVR